MTATMTDLACAVCGGTTGAIYVSGYRGLSVPLHDISNTLTGEPVHSGLLETRVLCGLAGEPTEHLDRRLAWRFAQAVAEAMA